MKTSLFIWNNDIGLYSASQSTSQHRDRARTRTTCSRERNAAPQIATAVRPHTTGEGMQARGPAPTRSSHNLLAAPLPCTKPNDAGERRRTADPATRSLANAVDHQAALVVPRATQSREEKVPARLRLVVSSGGG